MLIEGSLFMTDPCTSYEGASAPKQRPSSPHSDLVSPEVLPDGRITFRIYAPRASEVSVEGEWIRQGLGSGGPLTEDDEGIWSLTVGPLPPDFYTYAFAVDGVRTIDPQNTWIKPGNSRLENVFLVPGREVSFSETRPVPHGQVRIVWYDSPALGGARSMRVYTPPGYEASDATYPVFYLIHGGGDNDAGWTTIGRANFILDNLLAARKAQPMIVVMPNGSVPRKGRHRLVGAERSDPAAIKERIEAIAASHDTFVEDLLQTIMPTVEGMFRVRTDRESRAIAGLSMGGAETLRVAPSNLDKFAYIGVFSMGLQVGAEACVNTDFEERNAAFFADPARTNERLKLFYIASGDDDQIVTDGPRRLSATLTQHGIEHTFNETTGGHTWINWRRYLYEFAQLLFRD
jgi:enterochelin esterase family protein